MNKKVIFLVCVISILATVGFASAASITNPLGQIDTFPKLLESVIKTILTVVGYAGVVGVIGSGLLYVLSAGEPGKLGAAKTALTYSVLGIIVGFGAQGIADLVKSVKTGTTLSDVAAKIAEKVGELIAGAGSIMVIVAGALFVTSGGDPAKITRAKSALLWAVIGIIIGLGAVGIVGLIKNVAGVTGVS
jgi:hypothetical protein